MLSPIKGLMMKIWKIQKCVNARRTIALTHSKKELLFYRSGKRNNFDKN